MEPPHHGLGGADGVDRISGVDGAGGPLGPAWTRSALRTVTLASLPLVAVVPLSMHVQRGAVLAMWVALGAVCAVVAHLALRSATLGAPARLVALAAWAACWGALPAVIDAATDDPVRPVVAMLVPMTAATVALLLSAARAETSVVLAGLLGAPVVWAVGGPRSVLLPIAVHGALVLAARRPVESAIAQRRVFVTPLGPRDAPVGLPVAPRSGSVERRRPGLDPLTGLQHRDALLDTLDTTLASVDQRGGHVVVVVANIDRFQVVNDALGHSAGDQLLALVAGRLSSAAPPPACLGRLVGDSFVMFRWVPDAPVEEIAELATAAAACFDEPFDVDGQRLNVTCSMGAVHGPGQGAVGRDLLRFADAAMHRAKAEGRDRLEAFDDARRSSLTARVSDEQELRAALDRGEIVPWYQPIVDASCGRIVGAELLARWVPPAGPARRAGSFMPVMYESGLIERFSEEIIERGLDDLRAWAAAGLPSDFRLGVNLPPRYVSRSGRAERLVGLFAAAPADHLVAEVTETSVVDDLDLAAHRLAELRALGIRTVLDDFGTGSASLTLLQRVPLDGVKVDRSFVTDIVTSEHDRALVNGFVDLANRISISVTVEGVETTEQSATLVGLGCTRQQGYLFGAAMTGDELLAALAGRPGRGARRRAATTRPT